VLLRRREERSLPPQRERHAPFGARVGGEVRAEPRQADLAERGGRERRGVGESVDAENLLVRRDRGRRGTQRRRRRRVLGCGDDNGRAAGEDDGGELRECALDAQGIRRRHPA